MSESVKMCESSPPPMPYVDCSVCGESYAVDYEDLNRYYNANICPRCKKAIMFARKLMEEQDANQL